MRGEPSRGPACVEMTRALCLRHFARVRRTRVRMTQVCQNDTLASNPKKPRLLRPRRGWWYDTWEGRGIPNGGPPPPRRRLAVKRNPYGDLAVVYAEETGLLGTRAEEVKQDVERELARNFRVLGIPMPCEEVPPQD